MKAAEPSQIRYDLCILGGGLSGIILALEYCTQNPGHQVLLVEYGNLKPQPQNSLDNSISLVNTLNHHSPYECTNKALGGTTASWGGRCVMFDEIDFLNRDIVNGACTWNIALFQELKKHTPRAAEYLECGSAIFNLKEYPQHRDSRIAEGFLEGPITDSCLERWSPPTRMGKRYARKLEQQPGLHLLLDHEARSFAEPNHRGEVGSVWVRKVGDKALREIRARAFVLAAGAQETTRLLLRNKQLFSLLGNPPQALGKYYQGHISGKIASVQFWGNPKKTDWGFLRDADGTYLRRRFQFSTDFLLEMNLLNTAIWLDNPLYYDPKHRSGAMSLMYLAMLMPLLGKKLAPPAIAHSVTKGKVVGIEQHLFNILKGLPHSLLSPAQIFYQRYCQKRGLPGVFLHSPKNQYALHFHAEQQPYAGNRMELGADGESLIIHYAPTEADVQSVINLHEALDRWLRKCGCGALQYWYPRQGLGKAIRNMTKDGIHQTGTTRIADSPQQGVVDRDLKLWGTSNVWVCSSSVFPTSGQANPSFLLGTFAVRLAKHLSKRAAMKQELPMTALH